MNNFLSDEKKTNKYLENLLLLILQKKKIKEYIYSHMDSASEFDCYLINNDAINLYLKNEKISDCIKIIDNYKEKQNISKYNDLYNEKHIKNIIKIFNNNNVKVKIINLFPIFLLTENMTYSGINIPCNFFILEKKIFYRIFGNDPNFLKDFKLYKVLISKEGIFIRKKENKNNEKIIVYYLYNINQDIFNNENKCSMVFIFKTKENFDKELSDIIKIGRKEYFKTRNIQNKNGFYNLNYDGKIIGQYIHININENYKSKNSGDSASDNINKILGLDQTKNFIINIFLSNILTCLSKIKSLNDELIKRMKLNVKNINDNKYYLINKLTEFIIAFNNNNDDNKISNILNDFQKELKKINFYGLIEANRENEYILFENIIKIFLNELNEEASNSYNDDFGEKYNDSFIFKIFYGEKIIGENREFNTIFIDLDHYGGNVDLDLNDIINNLDFKEKQSIKNYPKIMIFIVNNKYKNFFIAPLKLKITNEKNYNLLSCIQYSESNFSSIIKENKNFIKIYWNEDNNFMPEDILEQDKELNSSFVYFYEQENENLDNKEFYIKNNNAININYNNHYFNSNNLNNNNYNILNKNSKINIKNNSKINNNNKINNYINNNNKHKINNQNIDNYKYNNNIINNNKNYNYYINLDSNSFNNNNNNIIYKPNYKNKSNFNNINKNYLNSNYLNMNNYNFSNHNDLNYLYNNNNLYSNNNNNYNYNYLNSNALNNYKYNL